MRRVSQAVALLFAATCFAACSPARTGVIGSTLTTNERTAISITANPPLTLADAGKVWAVPKSNMMTTFGNASFDYAIYTEKGVSPATRMACAAIIRLTDKERWAFQPQTNIPGTFGRETVPDYDGRDGRGYTLRVTAAGDWVSDVLAVNGTTPPQTWLAKRWVFVLEQNVRAIAEYREAWPENLEAPGGRDVTLLRDRDVEALRAFENRAEKAFRFSADEGIFTGAPQASTWVMPRTDPDVAALAGEVMYLEFHGSGNSGLD